MEFDFENNGDCSCFEWTKLNRHKPFCTYYTCKAITEHVFICIKERKGVFCGKPKLRDFVNVVRISGASYFYGDKIKFQCRAGVAPARDPPVITCLSDGTWDGDIACGGKADFLIQHGTWKYKKFLYCFQNICLCILIYISKIIKQNCIETKTQE